MGAATAQLRINCGLRLALLLHLITETFIQNALRHFVHKWIGEPPIGTFLEDFG